MFGNFFLSKAERSIRNADLDKAVGYLSIISNPKSTNELVKNTSVALNTLIKSLEPKRQSALIKHLYSDSTFDSKFGKTFSIPHDKSFREMCFHFFGMDENWKLGRNLMGGLMVHSPEYPTYFIPAFTQAEATGSAGELKKGEIPRGLITGGLEGVAVGALVSGKFIKPKEMGPYIFLGAALQLLSSTLFPWLGEKSGRFLYNRKMAKRGLLPAKVSDKNPIKTVKKNTTAQIGPKKDSSQKFTGKSPYSHTYSTGMRI